MALEFDDDRPIDDDPHAPNEPLFRGVRRDADEISLVFLAVGIPHKTSHGFDLSEIRVRPADRERALAEIERMRAEAATDRAERAIRPPSPFRATGRGAAAALSFFLWMAAQAIAQGLSVRHGRFAAAVLWPRRFREGEVWRALTALGLHGDAFHLLSNALFGTLFLYLLGETVGVGAAIGGVLWAGAIGNAISAIMKAGDVTSIGASTAVFAALGILGGTGFDKRLPRPATVLGRFKRFGPFIAALALLAMYGGAERFSDAFQAPGLVVAPDGVPLERSSIDVLAHTTGFLTGVGFGILAGAGGRSVASPARQWSLAISAIIIYAAAWAAIYLGK